MLPLPKFGPDNDEALGALVASFNAGRVSEVPIFALSRGGVAHFLVYKLTPKAWQKTYKSNAC